MEARQALGGRKIKKENQQKTRPTRHVRDGRGARKAGAQNTPEGHWGYKPNRPAEQPAATDASRALETKSVFTQQQLGCKNIMQYAALQDEDKSS